MDAVEMWYEIESYIYRSAMILVMGYVFFRFAEPFMRKRKNAFFAGAAYCLVMFFWSITPIRVSNFAAYGMGVAAAFLTMCLTERKNYRQKIFLAVTFFSLRWLAPYMAEACLKRAGESISDTLYLGGNVLGRFCSYVGLSVLKLALTFVLLRVSTGLIAAYYPDKWEDMTTREMLMLITPSAAGMTEYWMVKYYQSYIEGEVMGELSKWYYDIAFFHYGMCIVTIVVGAVLFQSIKAKKEEELRNGMLSEQMNSMRRHIGQVESLYQDIRGMKHDMANHILTLEKLCCRKDAAKEYVEDWKRSLVHAEGEINSGNPITDVVLSEWKGEAEKRNIRFRCEFHFPTESRINAFDLSVLLNNALQNAIENTAGGKDAYIEIESYRRRNVFMIEIRNTFAGKLQWDTERMLPVTSKENADSRSRTHGYGLYNIKKVAESYMGDIDISAEDGEFRLSILLMLK